MTDRPPLKEARPPAVEEAPDTSPTRPEEARFHPAVLSFEREDLEHGRASQGFLYKLREDLDRLARNQQAMDADATVFFCARILEITAARAVGFAPAATGVGAPTQSLCANLDQLEKRRLLPSVIATWAHSLRLLGNTARHYKRPITSTDAQLATAFLEGYLTWFFCEYEFQLDGYKADRLLSDSMAPPAFATSEAVARLVRWLGASPPELDKLVEAASAERSVFLESPVFSTLTAEKLLAAGREDEAHEVLLCAAAHHPGYRRDLRLRQLMGLYHSRLGELDEAERWLTGGSRDFAKDPETTGIHGGTYKRRYQQLESSGGHVLASLRWLRKANQTYLDGWSASEQTNFYLGINAAATSLWLGELEYARATATQIASRLGWIRKQLVDEHHERRDNFDLWDELTLLEAELILGRFAEVETKIVEVLSYAGRGRSRDIEVFLAQARKDIWALRELSVTDLPNDFVDRCISRPDTSS